MVDTTTFLCPLSIYFFLYRSIESSLSRLLLEGGYTDICTNKKFQFKEIMKKFSSVHQDKNNDDITSVVNVISDNRKSKLKSIKNVIELPDVWKRTNSYISSNKAGISKSTSNNSASITISDDWKLSFDISLSNKGDNNNNRPQISLAHDDNKFLLAKLGLNSTPLTSTKTVKKPNNDNASLFGFHHDDKHKYLQDVGVSGGFEHWDGGKPNLLLQKKK